MMILCRGVQDKKAGTHLAVLDRQLDRDLEALPLHRRLLDVLAHLLGRLFFVFLFFCFFVWLGGMVGKGVRELKMFIFCRLKIVWCREKA